MIDDGFPLYLTFRKAGKILGWHHLTAKKWAVAHGLVVNVGDREFVSVYKFKQVFPDVWDEIRGRFEE